VVDALGFGIAKLKQDRTKYLKHIEIHRSKMSFFLSVLGLDSLWVLLFRASTYAVPIFVGLTAGSYAFKAGAGPIDALALGAVASGAFLAASQAAFSLSRSLLLRGLIPWCLLFRLPMSATIWCLP
jgi:hypothetical protein